MLFDRSCEKNIINNNNKDNKKLVITLKYRQINKSIIETTINYCFVYSDKSSCIKSYISLLKFKSKVY